MERSPPLASAQPGLHAQDTAGGGSPRCCKQGLGIQAGNGLDRAIVGLARRDNQPWRVSTESQF